jgi:RecB family exonuclease
MSFSNSSIKTYEQCPYKYKLTRIEGLKEPAGPAADRGKDIHYTFEQAIKGLNLLPEEFKYWTDYIDTLKSNNTRAEEEFGLTIDWEPCAFSSDKVWLRGVIDAIYSNNNTAHILDWKTGKTRDYAEQLRLYACVVFALHPELENISLEICYIDQNKREDYGIIFRDEFPALKEWVSNRITKIERDDIYAPKPEYGCRWCHFRKSNGGPCRW